MRKFDFRLDPHAGTTHLQLVRQVRHAITAGQLVPGEQLPTVREVVERLVVSPNTVLKAYHDLEIEGLLVSRQGVGTFVQPDLAVRPPSEHGHLRHGLARWLAEARAAGLSEDEIDALISVTRQDAAVTPGENIA
jgi:DNA-binding transcriptional regulator YhcF (GntR family)